jgi:hypothetical protein
MAFREKLIALDAALTHKGEGTAKYNHRDQADFGHPWYWWDTWDMYHLSDKCSRIAFDPAKKRIFLTRNSRDEVRKAKEINQTLWNEVEQEILTAETDPRRMKF